MIVLLYASAALVGLNVMCLIGLSAHRLRLTRDTRIRARLEHELEPVALSFVEGDADRRSLGSRRENEVLAEILGRYSRLLGGEGRDRVATFFERSGGVDSMLSMLRSRRGWRRATAAFALGDIGSPRAVGPLLGALRDSERDVRAAAARSLGRLEALDAVEPLVEALAEGRVPRAVVGRALLSIGPSAAPTLRRLVKHRDQAEREGAVQLLGLVGEASDATLLTACLKDTAAGVRAQAARALGRLGATSAASALQDVLRDRIPFVRGAAADALGQIGGHSAVPGLLAQAAWDEHAPSVAAARALAQLDRQELLRASRGSGTPPAIAEAADLAALTA